MGNSGNSEGLYFGKLKITADGDCSHEIKRHLLLGREAMTNLDSVLERRGIILPTRIQIVKAMTFLVVLYGCELDHKEGWALKNWCFLSMVLEKTLESPLDSKEMKPVNPYQMIWYSHLLKNIPQFVVSHTVNREKENFTHLNKGSKE